MASKEENVTEKCETSVTEQNQAMRETRRRERRARQKKAEAKSLEVLVKIIG